MRLGDLDALKEAINKIIDEEIEIDEKWAIGLKYSLKLIDNAPTIETERPQGKWVVDGCLIACNKCGRILLKASELYNFCPECGVDMRGGAE